jgi:hypothetical protein
MNLDSIAPTLRKASAWLMVVLLAMSIQFARGADLPAVIDRPRAQDGPTQVSVGIWTVDIGKIDSEAVTSSSVPARQWNHSPTNICASL